MTLPFVACASSATRLEEAGRTHEAPDILTSFWEDASGQRLGFATNWTEKPEPLELSWPDGTRETRLLTPRETILFTPRSEAIPGSCLFPGEESCRLQHSCFRRERI